MQQNLLTTSVDTSLHSPSEHPTPERKLRAVQALPTTIQRTRFARANRLLSRLPLALLPEHTPLKKPDIVQEFRVTNIISV
ncbi:hypothetical protein GBAR_LOCUS21734 [Geodia barretti]|uniref:Uncharacterized protein n=1 Tax=Geodia barretti TaxID=519541 RepID=A0AA35SZM7_GEOBA|nr:hypothetical protein GBAR_LOCUS21734 [Geodia barretti]